MRWPSTSSRRSTTCRKPAARRSSCVRVPQPWRRARASRSAGAISICRPRRPPLTMTVGCASAAASTNIVHALALAERRDAADVIAGDALGLGGRQHRGILRAGRGGELLQADLAVAGDQHADHRAAGLRHQRLEQPRRRNAERLGRLHADAFGVRIVVVFVQLERDAGLLQRRRSRACPSPS